MQKQQSILLLGCRLFVVYKSAANTMVYDPVQARLLAPGSIAMGRLLSWAAC